MTQFAGVVITAGIVLATLSAPSRRSSSTGPQAAAAANASTATTPETADTAVFVTGIAMLCAALVMSALLGLWQERIYKVYGTVWQEGLFYSVSVGQVWRTGEAMCRLCVVGMRPA
jgi:UDP-xylose/UDP-N-acetylglucosamine transporter B4